MGGLYYVWQLSLVRWGIRGHYRGAIIYYVSLSKRISGSASIRYMSRMGLR